MLVTTRADAPLSFSVTVSALLGDAVGAGSGVSRDVREALGAALAGAGGAVGATVAAAGGVGATVAAGALGVDVVEVGVGFTGRCCVAGAVAALGR